MKIGLIVNTQGIQGEVRVYPLTDYKERFEELKYVYLEGNLTSRLDIQRVKYKKNLAIIKFKDFNNINQVLEFKNKHLYIDESQIKELPADTYYIIDLIGCNVYKSEDNSYIGEVIDVNQNLAQDTYVVKLDNDKTKNKIALIPAVEEFIKEVDIKEKRIKVKLIEGMIE